MDNIFLALMLLPPLGAAFAIATSLFLGDRLLGWRQVQRLTFAATALSALGGGGLLVARVLDPQATTVKVMTWFEMGGQSIDLAFRLDPLSAVMAALVTGFGLVICRFSINYMHNETGFTRYFAAYALFLAMMLVLVLADNLVLMFLGWEGVGLCSFLLIGHYAQRPAAARAATEAFVANRVGDAGLILGILILMAGAGTVRFADLPAALAGAEGWVAPAAAFCLLVGALGKSAQIPLGGWLAKAMEGPTPSSALIHAATMVTAGVYLVVRAHPLFEAAPAMLVLAGLLGALTALYGALGGQAATDIKGVLAASTTMHLGLMLVACGFGAYGVAIFYVVAHAFYKAYQFLTAPSILHHLHGKLDFARQTAPDAAPDSAPVPAWVAVALVAAVALMLAPPVLALGGLDLSVSAAFAALAGASALALALMLGLARAAVAATAPGNHHHVHDHEHGHDHHHDHGHPHAEAEAASARGLGPAGSASVAVLLAALGGAVLQLVPGGLSGGWFNAFLGLPQGSVMAQAPGMAVLLALALALMAAHSVLTAVLMSRHLPEAALVNRPALRILHSAAANRLWIDAAIHARLLPLVAAVSERLARLDIRASDAALAGGARAATETGDAVAWLDGAPRRAAESMPGAIGLQLAEVTRQVERQTTEGFDASMGRASGLAGRTALRVERALGRPVVSVGLIVLVALAALAGA